MPHKEEYKQPATASTTLNYLSPDGYPDGKKVILLGSPNDKFRKYDRRPAVITDMRSCDEDFNIDKNGFQLVIDPTSLSRADFKDFEFVQKNYYTEASDMLQRVTGASSVVCMSHLIRDATWEEVQEEAKKVQKEAGANGLCMKINPGRSAHCDQSYLGAEQLLRMHFGDEEAERLMEKRWGIINVWRPLKTIRRDPLAVCDFRTLDDTKDLEGVDLVLPPPDKHRLYGSSHGTFLGSHKWNRWDVRYSSNHKWYYVSHMQPKELLLLKIFDSKKDGRARCCPHTSFPTEQDEGPARESVELRTFVFWDDQTAE